MVAPVWLVELYAMPAHRPLANQLNQGHPLAFWGGFSKQSSRDEQLHKAVHIRIPPEQGPIKPVGLVILAVSVVISVLRSPGLISHQEHGNSKGEQCGRYEIFHLAGSESFNLGIRRGTLDATVPASIVIAAVTVLLAVGLVVFLVVRDQIIKRKSVVTGNEVHRLFRLTLLVPIDFVAAKEPVRERPQCPVVSAEETPNVVPEAPVPFLPAISNKAPHLVQSGGVPSFSDHFCSGENRIGLNIPEDRRDGHYVAAVTASQDRCEIETEAIHVHLFDPIAKTVHNHSANDRMISIERISSSAVVGVTRPVLLQEIVGAVVDAAKTQCRPMVVAFRRVIEHDVQNDLNACSMQALDHIAKLIHGAKRVAPRTIGLMRCEE